LIGKRLSTVGKPQLIGLVALAMMMLMGLARADEHGVADDKEAGETATERPVLDLMEVRPYPATIIDDDPAWPARLRALFEETVLHDEGKRPRGVNKWVKPINLSLRGDAADDVAVFVEAIADELSALIDLPIELYVNQNWAGDIDIYITYWKNYWPFFIQSTEPGRPSFTCAVLPWVDDGLIKRATIKINAGVLDDATVRACLLEELTQSLGLFGETEMETDTILHDGIGYEGLGAIDRVLIRTLYDKRLTLGMTNDQAMALVGMILDEMIMETVNAQPTAPSDGD